METIRKIQASFGDDALGVTQIKKWYSRCKDDRPHIAPAGLQQDEHECFLSVPRCITHHRVKQSPKSTTGIVLRHLRDAVRCKRPELWSTGNWHLHHDNAPAYSSHLIQTFWQKTRLLWFARLLSLMIWFLATSGCSCPKVGYSSNRQKPDENTKNYLTQMLLAIN